MRATNQGRDGSRNRVGLARGPHFARDTSPLARSSALLWASQTGVRPDHANQPPPARHLLGQSIGDPLGDRLGVRVVRANDDALVGQPFLVEFLEIASVLCQKDSGPRLSVSKHGFVVDSLASPLPRRGSRSHPHSLSVSDVVNPEKGFRDGLRAAGIAQNIK